MFSHLKDYLIGVVTPETMGLYVEAAETLTNVGTHKHELGIEHMLSLADNSDDAVTISSLEGALRTALLDYLSDFTIEFMETDISTMLETVKGLHLLESYGDPIALLEVCDAGLPDEEAFSELMALVTSIESPTYQVQLASVSPLLIERIRDVAIRVEAHLDEEIADDGGLDDETPTLAAVRNRLRHFLDQHTGLIISQEIADGMRVLLDFEIYIEGARAMLEDQRPEGLGRELLAMALASSLPESEIESAISEQLEIFLVEHTAIQRAILAVRQGLAA